MKTTLVIVLSVALAAGAFAANRLSAQTTGTRESGVPPASTVLTQDATTLAPPPPALFSPANGTTTTAPGTTTMPPSASVPLAAGVASVQNIVEITRLVPAGTTAVTAFTVPAGVVLVITDVLVTNTGTAATCGGALNRTGAATAAPTTPPAPSTPTPTSPNGTAPNGTTPNGTTPTDSTAPVTPGTTVATTVAGTVTQTDSTVTGPLCVPAQTTTTLPLTTGIEFASGQSVQLVNTPDAAAAGTAAGSLGFHLRGLLVTLT